MKENTITAKEVLLILEAHQAMMHLRRKISTHYNDEATCERLREEIDNLIALIINEKFDELQAEIVCYF